MREGWKHVELGEHIDLLTGYPFKSSEYSENGNGIRLLRGDNVVQGSVRWDDARRWPQHKVDGLDRFQLAENDVVLALDRTWVKAGLKSATIRRRDLPCILVQRVARIRAMATIDQRFLATILQSHRFVEMVKSSKTETAVPHISPNDIRDFVIDLPPLPEQRKIAEILRTWDEALEKLTAQRTAHEDRLVGLRDTLMARASRHGQPVCFADFLTESRIPGTDGATARKISVRLYGKGATEKIEPRPGSANTRYYRRAAGQIIWSKLDFLNGAFALVGAELDGCESTLDLPAFDCDSSVNPVWLIEYLTRPAYYTRQIHLARGQRKARRIAPDDWLASPVRLPDRVTQDRVADTLTCVRTELSLIDDEIEALTRQKRGLMQKLLTGEWRVAV